MSRWRGWCRQDRHHRLADPGRGAQSTRRAPQCLAALTPSCPPQGPNSNRRVSKIPPRGASLLRPAGEVFAAAPEHRIDAVSQLIGELWADKIVDDAAKVAQIEALIADASSLDELDRLEAALKSRDYDSVLAPPPPLEEAGTVV